MKIFKKQLVTIVFILFCSPVFADSSPTSLESKYFMAANSCYQPHTSGKIPYHDGVGEPWGGNFNVYKSAYVECVVPLEHDRDIGSIVISVDNFDVALRTCTIKVNYAGSTRFSGSFSLVPYINTGEHYRIDNLGSFPRTWGGHQLIGAVINCVTGNPTSSYGHTRFQGIRVDYN